MYISKAKIARRNNLLKLFLPIVAIESGVILYFVYFNTIYKNGGYETYSDECETLASAYCNIYILTGEYPKVEDFK
jgi:hypothetical protein